jgi:thymidylate synthase
LKKIVLPPCHVLAQFYVSEPLEPGGLKRLACKLTQRSCDTFLGAPFNIASYSLLTHMLAHLCTMDVDCFIYSLGDTHIYQNHLDQVREQLSRPLRPLPQLRIERKGIERIEDFCFDDFKLIGYTPHPVIAADMSV